VFCVGVYIFYALKYNWFVGMDKIDITLKQCLKIIWIFIMFVFCVYVEYYCGWYSSITTWIT